MQPKIWPFMIVGLAVPMISGCTGGMVSCTTFFGAPSQFKTVDIPDAVTTTLTGINNSGEIVGYSTDSRGITRAFRGGPSNFVPVDPPPLPGGPAASSSEAYAINNRGNIVIIGHYQGRDRPYLLDGTSFLPLPATGGPLIRPGGVSDGPQVVGPQPFALISLTQDYQYDVTNSKLIPVTIFENMPTYLSGINNDRRMVGSVKKDQFTTQAFYLASSDVTSAHTIEISGATSSNGNGINNAADPGCTRHVGVYWTADGNSHGFVHLQAAQQPATFDVPNAAQTAAYGVNDNGDIVGVFQDKAGKTHGFFAPDP